MTTARAVEGNHPLIRVVKPPTAGVWSDLRVVQESLSGVVSPTTQSPFLYVLDLMDVIPTVDVFEQYLVPFGQTIKHGERGSSSLAISTRNPGVRRYAELLSAQLELPVWIAASTATLQVAEASPAGALTQTDLETLDAVVDLGGAASASEVAARLRIQHTAAHQRLVALAARRYLHRRERSGRRGELFVHPLQPAQQQAINGPVGSVAGTVDGPEVDRVRDHMQGKGRA
jgi:hypothetical protein